MPLYSPLNNRETKPGLSTRSKPLMIPPRLLRPDQIQGRGSPGKQSPRRWVAGPSPSTNAPGVSAPGLSSGTWLECSDSAPLLSGAPGAGPFPKGGIPDAGAAAPLTHVHAHAPGAHLAGALLLRAWGPRAPTPRRLTGTALPAAPPVRSPRPGPLSYSPRGRPLHSPPRRRCRPPTPPCSCSERRGRGGGRGSEPGARTHGRARTPQAGAAAGPGGGGEAGGAEVAAARG